MLFSPQILFFKASFDSSSEQTAEPNSCLYSPWDRTTLYVCWCLPPLTALSHTQNRTWAQGMLQSLGIPSPQKQGEETRCQSHLKAACACRIRTIFLSAGLRAAPGARTWGGPAEKLAQSAHDTASQARVDTAFFTGEGSSVEPDITHRSCA